MRKFLFLILACSLFTSLSAQNYEGIWISSSRMDIQKRTVESLFEDDDISPQDLDNIKIDTSYLNAYALIHFLDNKKIIFQGIGGKKKLGKYTKVLDTLYVEIDTINFKLFDRKENLILLDLDTSWQKSHLIFEKMLPISNLSIDDLELNFKKESYWKISTDSDSTKIELEIHFLDSGSVMLSQFYDGVNTTTSWGEYKTAIYKNNLFLYILDRQTLDDRMYRIYSTSTNKFVAQYFDAHSGKVPPSKLESKFIKASLPKEKALIEIEKSLIGVWFLDDTFLPFDTAFSDYTSFNDQFYKLTFSEQGNFSIYYGGTFGNENENKTRSKEINGTWEIGPTGRYIKLQVDEGYLEYMTLIELKSKTLSIGMDTETLDYEMTYSHHLIRLKKGANN